jgi:hypothetical protein
MCDQAGDKIDDIMRARPGPALVSSPSWLALVLILGALHLLAITSP